jgi:hypothetical protein
MQRMLGLTQALLHDLRHSLAAPSRGPRTAVVVGRLLAVAFLLCFGTGVYSHFIQDPLPWMVFPTRPIWLYQVTQGIHITAGILCFPLILAKLYSVYPQLFTFPPVRSFPQFLERASIAIFVAASLVQITIGLINTYQWYQLFPFPFRQTHYALSYVVIGSLAIHIAVKLPIISQHWTKKRHEHTLAAEEAPVEGEAESLDIPEPSFEFPESHYAGVGHGMAPRPAVEPQTGGLTGKLFAWIDATPQPQPRVSRRGFLVAVTATSAALVALTAGQSFKVFDGVNLFAPRKQGVGPNALPVNRTAEAAKVVETASSPGWRLTLIGPDGRRDLDYADLKALPQYDVDLPIACVEGWSQMASWRGPRLRDLADLAGMPAGATIRVTSLEDGPYGLSEVTPEFARDELTLVALELNGEVLDLDHGYPARLIAPARPGVRQTKWLSRLEVQA